MEFGQATALLVPAVGNKLLAGKHGKGSSVTNRLILHISFRISTLSNGKFLSVLYAETIFWGFIPLCERRGVLQIAGLVPRLRRPLPARDLFHPM